MMRTLLSIRSWLVVLGILVATIVVAYDDEMSEGWPDSYSYEADEADDEETYGFDEQQYDDEDQPDQEEGEGDGEYDDFFDDD